MKEYLKGRAITLVAVALVVAASSAAGYVAYALFGTTATSSSNAVTAGSGAIVIAVDAATPTYGSTANSALSIAALAKDGVEVPAGSVWVKNDGGSANFKYVLASTQSAGSNNDFINSLQVSITKSTVSAGTTCAATKADGTNTQIIDWVAYKTSTAADGVKFGSTGDISGTGRGLTNGSSERLCFYFKLPTSTPNTAQAGTVTITMTFTAVD